MCDYFILTKPNKTDVSQDRQNQCVSLGQHQTVYILPKNNMTYYMNNGLFEKSLIEWTKQFCSKEKIMLDIGAHTGTYAISLADHCKQVYAFEPQKMTYYALCGGVALSNIRNITCVNSGLGSEEQIGSQTLHIVSLDGGGSSLSSSDSVFQTESIEIKTLDSYNLEHVGFIKIDVEGNELSALRGALATLRKSNYPTILFEMNTEQKDLLDFLRGLNYAIVPVNNCGNMFLAVYETH